MKLTKKTILLTTILLVSGCAAVPYKTTTEGTNNPTVDSYGAGSSVYGTDGYTIPGRITTNGNLENNGRASIGDFYEDPSYGVNVVGGPSADAKDRVIYFSYDSSRLDARSEGVVAEHARYLRENSTTRVVLEGHTDERGSREYNVGLGERRAYSVRGAFIQQGVNPAQIRVLSYGEERPVADCSDERCYARNRRAVIVY